MHTNVFLKVRCGEDIKGVLVFIVYMERNRVIIVVIIAALFLAAIAGAAIIATTSSSSMMRGNFTESGDVKVIPVSGTITSSSSNQLFQQRLTSEQIADAIRDADANTGVDAILLEVNSPGGAPVASHEIVRAVNDVDKPIAAQIREVGASGAYWVASATDHIIADPVSITGSVGVTASYLEFSGLLDNYNVTYQQVQRGKYKELGSPFTELSDEEEAVLQSKIDAIGEYFFEDVAENRGLTQQERQRVRTGVFFVGVESEDVGLVDELGGEDTAIKYLENQTGKSLSTENAQFRQGFFSQLGQVSVKQELSFLPSLLVDADQARRPTLS
jgi:protease-4